MMWWLQTILMAAITVMGLLAFVVTLDPRLSRWQKVAHTASYCFGLALLWAVWFLAPPASP